METIKKLKLLAIAICFSNLLYAQTEQALQKAFAASYIAESKYNYTQAIADLTGIYNEQNYDLNLRLGWLSYAAKNYTASVKYYELACGLKPYAIEAKFGLIKPLSAIESWDKVIQQYEAILKIDPQNTSANYYLGYAFYTRKQYEFAQKNFEKVVNLYPFDYDSTIMLAWTYYRLGKNNEAKVVFNKVLLLSPNDASALEGLGLLK